MRTLVVFTTGAATLMMVLPDGADSGASTSESSCSEANVNQGPGRNDAGPSNVAPADSPLGSFPSVPSALSPLPSDPSVPSFEANNLFGREQSVEQPAPQQVPQIPPLAIPHAEQAIDDPFDSVFGNDFPRRTHFELYYFRSSFGGRSAPKGFRDRIAEELGLQMASEPELEQIRVLIRQLSQPDGRPASAQDAGAILNNQVRRMEKGQPLVIGGTKSAAPFFGSLWSM